MTGMSNSYTQYIGPGISVYDGDVNTRESSSMIPRMFRDVLSSPLLTWKSEKISMAAEDTRDLAPMLMGASADNEKTVCVIQVVGKIEVNTVGDDYDDSSPVAGVSQSFGTSYFPGFLILNTYNLDSIELEAIAASEVYVYSGVMAASTDSRL